MRYAAYGSNLHPLRLTERISSAKFVTTRFVSNWSLQFHKRSKDGSGKCNILPGGDGIHVAVFDISVNDKQILDRIEGLGVGYNTQILSLTGIGDCVTYVADASHIDDSLRPYDWYLALVLAGARLHGFPEDYVKKMTLQPTREDPDPARRANAWKTVELLRNGVGLHPIA